MQESQDKGFKLWVTEYMRFSCWLFSVMKMKNAKTWIHFLQPTYIQNCGQIHESFQIKSLETMVMYEAEDEHWTKHVGKAAGEHKLVTGIQAVHGHWLAAFLNWLTGSVLWYRAY